MLIFFIQRLWYARKRAKPHGSTFGILLGDLRTTDYDYNDSRGHAMNVVVLSDLTIWGVEPQNLKKYKFPRDWHNSTYVDRVFI